MVRAADISKRGALAVAGGVAVVFAVAVFASVAFAALTPPEPLAFATDSNSTTGYMILLGPLSAAWGFSVHLRCPDAFVRRCLLAIAALIAFWMLAVLVKYSIRDAVAASMLWYCYYIPMIAIPALCFACALRAAALDGTRAGGAALRVVGFVSVALMLLVLTNNAHHLVFAFDLADPDWEADYAYCAGYYVVAAWCVALLVAFFATLFLAARKQLRSAIVPLALVVGVGAAYGILYAFRHTIMLTSNISLTYCFLIMVALEIALDLRLLPSYAWYADAFQSLPFDLKLLGAHGEVELATPVANPLHPAAATMLADPARAEGETWAFRTSAIPATLFKTYPVRGGRALLAEDVSAIDERRAALEDKREHLRRSNALLARKAAVQREQCRLRSERELFGDIEASLESKTRRIKELLDALPASDDAAAAAKRREMLVEVKLLVAYCKRKGALVLAEKSDPEFNRERLQLVFNETAADLRSIGVDCAALVQTDAPLPASVVSVLYDCLYDFATAANAMSDAVLMLFVQAEPAFVVLRAALSAADVRSGRVGVLLDELREHLVAHGAQVAIELAPDSATFVARIPLEPGQSGDAR